MRKYIFTEKSHTFKRINKKTARTAYKNGLTVIICPWTDSQVKHQRPPHWEPWNNTIIAICSSKLQPRTASPPAGAYFIEWRYKTLIKKTWETPQGSYYNLFSDMLKQPHLLVAGATGSGKSVVINGIITTALKDSPATGQFIFIDPKRVDLIDYKPLPHTLKYASEPGDMVLSLIHI